MPPPRGASEPIVPVLNSAFADEIEAINSIYGASTLSLTTTPTSSADDHGPNHYHAAILCLPSQPSFSFILTFPLDYPNSSAPRIDGTESSSKKGAGTAAAQALREVIDRVWVPGQVCLFDVIEEAAAAVAAGSPSTTSRIGYVAQAEESIDVEEESSAPKPEQPSSPAVNLTQKEAPAAEAKDDDHQLPIKATNHLSPSPNQASPAAPPPIPHWTLSTPLTEKKSVFIARCASVHSASAASSAILHLLATDKKVASATHNISAWRIRSPPPLGPSPGTSTPLGPSPPGGSSPTATMVQQDYDDDGETAAGGRLLRLMQLMDVWDVVVVVSRWYGGVKLGPDRFRVINGVAREALVRGGFVVGKEGEGEGRSGKGKKGKGR